MSLQLHTRDVGSVVVIEAVGRLTLGAAVLLEETK